MDLMIVAAFVAFFAMIVAWMAAPTTGNRPVSAVADSPTLSVSEAQV
jgi:hypothetical protein